MADAPSFSTTQADNDRFDVLVLGAGMAGLACARVLAEQGQRVCLLEAQERVGGRILTRHVGDQVVELGAEFVHGRPPELLALIEEAGLSLCERGGAQVSYEEGRLSAEAGSRDEMFEPLEELRTRSGPDLSFCDFFDGSRFAGNRELRDAAMGYVEGFNAADAAQISAEALRLQQMAEDSIEGDRVAHVREGYDRVPRFLADRFLAAGGCLCLNTRVLAVRWGVGRVALETTAGERLARRAVLTVPLGVLQSHSVGIVPEPRTVLDAAALMRMGPVCRFTMIFHERFWETLPPQPAMSELSFLFDFGALPSVWWTTHPEGGRSLTGWVGGPRAQALLGKSDAELAEIGCHALARLFSLPESQVRSGMEACVTHDWSADPFFRGSYSYVAVDGSGASARMAAPVEHTLFFAGEHTDTTGHWGTVHGALRSGVRAARQVLGEV